MKCFQLVPSDRRLIGNCGYFGGLKKFSELGRLNEAVQAVALMHEQGHLIPAKILHGILQECIKKKDLMTGRDVHSLIVRSGLGSNTFLGSHLIHMFTLCGSLSEANQVFCKLPRPNVYTWSAIISAHAKLGQCEQAIELYQQMLQSHVQGNGHTFVAVLKACVNNAILRLINVHIIENGFEVDLFIANTLIDMYCKCGCLEDACGVFYRLPKRDIVTWNTMIAGYFQHGDSQLALQHFQLLQNEALEPNQATFVIIVKVSSSIPALDKGKLIHAYIIENGFGLDLYVTNSLIDMYAKCGALKDARLTFDRSLNQDVVAWSALITGYAQHGHGSEAFELFLQMQEKGIIRNQVTFVGILKACSSIACLGQGKLINVDIIQTGFELDMIVGNSLIDMYAKCGSMDDARIVFDRLPKQDVVTWCAMIAGYAQHGHGKEALQIFSQMQQCGMEPDGITFVGILKACSSMAALDQGKLIHAHILRSDVEVDVFVGSTLIDMYSECGSLEDAHLVFDRLPKENMVTWSAMISGCAQHKDHTMALRYFEEMQHIGLKPNEVTFLCLLSSFSHVGLVSEGYHWFKSMREGHSIAPTVDHYNCLIDLLGHAGCLNEAEDLLESLSFDQNIIGWRSLLNHCKIQGSVVLGHRCFNQIVAIDHREASSYILMAFIYAHAGMQECAEEVEELRKFANAWKKPAQAFIEIDNNMHDFIVGGKSHQDCGSSFSKLKRLSSETKEKGYMPVLQFLLPSVSDEDNENTFCGH